MRQSAIGRAYEGKQASGVHDKLGPLKDALGQHTGAVDRLASFGDVRKGNGNSLVKKCAPTRKLVENRPYDEVVSVR
ncbi:spidroin-1-like protein [Anopheles sinensis]|uniref:Spidroin-1-like protein n=1 Tax=Anopheles sinensis TaxID=74873 RepID=A0A084W5X2_ANOSI|nr:spidroin-1-like protein [Anopheles sinensis]